MAGWTILRPRRRPAMPAPADKRHGPTPILRRESRRRMTSSARTRCSVATGRSRTLRQACWGTPAAAALSPIHMVGGEAAMPPSYLWRLPEMPAHRSPWTIHVARENRGLATAWLRDRRSRGSTTERRWPTPPHDRYWMSGGGADLEVADNPAADGSRPFLRKSAWSPRSGRTRNSSPMPRGERGGSGSDQSDHVHGNDPRILWIGSSVLRRQRHHPPDERQRITVGALFRRSRALGGSRLEYLGAGARILQGIIANLPR